MSDRANGWLLILGGLAIGLVLWLSPSKESSLDARGLEAMARRELDVLIRRLNGGAEGACPCHASVANSVW